jgi:hypothetical protein
MQRIAHAFAALRHGLVGQTDNGEGMRAGADAHLHLDGARLDADEGERGNLPVHAHPQTNGCSVGGGKYSVKNKMGTLRMETRSCLSWDALTKGC